MPVDEIILFVFLALIAEIIGTISGFGSSIFFVPVALLFFDFHSVLGITAIFHLFSNVSKIVLFRQEVEWKIIIYMGIPAVLFVGLGAYLSQFYSNEFLSVGLAIFLVVFSVLMLIYKNFSIKASKLNSILGGTLSGFIAGIVGTGGAVRGITLSSFKLNKGVFIATSAIIDFGVDLSRSVVYYSNGYVHRHDFNYIFILIGVSFIGTFLGKKALNYISESQFRKIVLILIFLIGAVTIGKEIYSSCNT